MSGKTSRILPHDIGGALTVRRPWAGALVCLPDEQRKDVENRNWRPRNHQKWIGAWLLIHAGKEWEEGATAEIARIAGREITRSRHPFAVVSAKILGHWFMEGEPAGHIIGAVRIADFVEDSESPWFSGRWGWVFDRAVQFSEPVKAKGALSIWQPEWSVLKACLSQLNSSLNS